MTKNKSNIGYKVIIILLTLVIIWLFYDKMNAKKQNEELVTKIEKTTMQKDSIRNDLEDLYMTYNSLQSNNKTLNDSLTKQKEKIAKLMRKVKNMKNIDYSQIRALKKEVSTLKKIMKSYIHQIDSLYQQNKVLTKENKKIKTQYTQVVQEKQNLAQAKDSLEATVKQAQELTAYNTNMIALNRRDRSTRRIHKTRKFKICFLLSENKVTSTGTKKVYLRVTKPDGEVLRNDNSGFFNYQGKAIAFSSEKQIEYNGNSQNVCIFYNVERKDLPRGTYTAFLFIDGRQIGDIKIKLK